MFCRICEAKKYIMHVSGGSGVVGDVLDCSAWLLPLPAEADALLSSSMVESGHARLLFYRSTTGMSEIQKQI
jgi:hypothetical protein